MIKKYLKDQKGLTLIELLVVIVILGIIAAIAVPTIGNLMGNSKDKATVSEALQIIDAAKLYVGSGDAGDTTSFDRDDLADYIDRAPEGFTVSLSNNEYSISGHDAVSIADSDNNEVATEDELADWLDANK